MRRTRGWFLCRGAPGRSNRRIRVLGERVQLGLGRFAGWLGGVQGAVEVALVRVGVHNVTASTARVGPAGFAGPSRVAIRYAERMVAAASRSDSPACCAASPRTPAAVWNG